MLTKKERDSLIWRSRSFHIINRLIQSKSRNNSCFNTYFDGIIPVLTPYFNGIISLPYFFIISSTALMS